MTSFQRGSLIHQPALGRNRWNQLLTLLAGLFTGLAVLPLVVVIIYVLIKGGSLISFQLLTELPPPPGLDVHPVFAIGRWQDHAVADAAGGG